MNGSEFVTRKRFAWFDLKRPLCHYRRLLRQGLSPHGFSLAVAVGITIGILPILWGASLLCALLAWQLGLNQLVVQFFNYLVYPLQLSLFVPFAVWGRLLCPNWFESTQPLTMDNLQHSWTALGSWLLPTQLAALVGWVSMAPLFLLTAYGLSFCLTKAWGRRNKSAGCSQQTLRINRITKRT